MFKKGDNLGEKNIQWKGKTVGYGGVHAWVKDRKNKSYFCQECDEFPSYDLANISGEYKRDINSLKSLIVTFILLPHLKLSFIYFFK